MVPTMIAMVMNHPDFRPERLASLRDLVYGASPMPAALLERLMTTLPDLNLWQGYGMTECSSVLTFLTAADHRRGGPILRSAGRPMIGVNISVRRKDDTVAAAGRERRDLRPRRQLHARVLEPARADRRRVPRRLVPTPATPATSTRTATSTSSIGSRT